jgi:hypothetical protein
MQRRRDGVWKMTSEESCPVCEAELANEISFCSRCGWEIKYFVNLTPDEKKGYKQNLHKAKLVWKSQQVDVKPQFKRGIFEEKHEFKERIESNNPYRLSTAIFSHDLYDADNEVLPLELTFAGEFGLDAKKFFVNIKPNIAQKLSRRTSASVDVYFRVNDDPLIVDNIRLGKLIVNIVDNLPKTYKLSGYKIALSESFPEKDIPKNILDTAPDIEKSTYEKLTEFSNKLDGSYYLAGTATLKCSEYNIDSKIFPIDIEWESWISVFNIQNTDFIFYVDRDTAKKLCILKIAPPIYICIKLEKLKNDRDYKIIIYDIVLYVDKSFFSIFSQKDEDLYNRIIEVSTEDTAHNRELRKNNAILYLQSPYLFKRHVGCATFLKCLRIEVDNQNKEKIKKEKSSGRFRIFVIIVSIVLTSCLLLGLAFVSLILSLTIADGIDLRNNSWLFDFNIRNMFVVLSTGGSFIGGIVLWMLDYVDLDENENIVTGTLLSCLFGSIFGYIVGTVIHVALVVLIFSVLVIGIVIILIISMFLNKNSNKK